MTELDMFFSTWEQESDSTLKVLRALPVSQYDFRPDPEGAPWASSAGISPRVTPT